MRILININLFGLPYLIKVHGYNMLRVMCIDIKRYFETQNLRY